MKYLDEFRDPVIANAMLRRIRATATRPWVIMEVCGGQTHAIVRYGIDQLLAGAVELVHGPGCPVCVTPLGTIDAALEIAEHREVILTSYGDMLRVPGSTTNLLTLKASGADVRIVSSPLDAVSLAASNPDRQVVFFAVGFETTAPASAMAVLKARQSMLTNFSMLVSHVLIPPAMTALLSMPGNRVNAYLAAGHVCTISGLSAYETLCSTYRVPVVATGFEPLDLLDGILVAVVQLENGICRVENRYQRAVNILGNPHAQRAVDEVFEIVDSEWRGLGPISMSGLRLRARYAGFDAHVRFDIAADRTAGNADCLSGEILRGTRRPVQCPSFGTTCTPLTPLGATMVLSEGACAAYYKYNRRLATRSATERGVGQ